MEDKSILDAVNADVKRMRGKVGGTDRAKVDQYLDAIRDVERRMQLAEKQDIHALPVGVPPGAPEVFSDYFKLMADLMVLSWQTDMTRVITFQMGHEMSGRAYPELGFGDAHHPCTHHQGDREKQEKTTQINGLHTKMLAYYLGKLRDTKDGEGSLLDHSMILYGAGLVRCQPASLYRSVACAHRGRRQRHPGRRACPLSEAHADDQPAADHARQVGRAACRPSRRQHGTAAASGAGSVKLSRA
jgi:hypothetical protein